MSNDRDREYIVKRAVLRCLAQCGDYMLLDQHLFCELELKVPQLRRAEMDSALRDLESRSRVLSVKSERGEKWRITDAGRADLLEN